MRSDQGPLQDDLGPELAAILPLEEPVEPLWVSLQGLLDLLHRGLLIKGRIFGTDLLDLHLPKFVASVAHQLGLAVIDYPDRPRFGAVERDADLRFFEDFFEINGRHWRSWYLQDHGVWGDG